MRAASIIFCPWGLTWHHPAAARTNLQTDEAVNRTSKSCATWLRLVSSRWLIASGVRSVEAHTDLFCRSRAMPFCFCWSWAWRCLLQRRIRDLFLWIVNGSGQRSWIKNWVFIFLERGWADRIAENFGKKGPKNGLSKWVNIQLLKDKLI